MSLEAEKNNIDAAIERIHTETKEYNEREALLNAQIAALRLDLAKINDQRRELKLRHRGFIQEKESIERKLELEKQAEETKKQIAVRRAEIQEIIDKAPWKDVAFEWQIEGALNLPDRAIIADKRGMGKTLSALIWRKLHGSKRTLICVRAQVASDFIKEIHIREPGTFVYPMLSASPFEREVAAMLLNGHEEYIVVTNIESWRRTPEETINDILKVDYDGVILDEAHNIKKATTGTAQGFFKLANAIPKVLELTGTPLKNRPQDMYSLFHALYPDLFPRESKFLFDYCIQIGQNKWIFSPMGLKTLIQRIEGFFIARTPEDIGRQIPPPRMIEYKLDFEGYDLQRQAYKDLTERALAVLNSGKVIPIVSQLAIMTRQAQAVSWPAGIEFDGYDEWGNFEERVQFSHVQQSVKMDWAEDLIKELVEEEERVIMFSRFKPAIYELKSRLEKAGLRVAVITGDQTKIKGNTEDIFDDFDLKTASKGNYKYDVLLATYQTVGESANLNAARHMVLYDRFWNPGNEDQAIGRIDRLNSIDQATIHVPLVENTIDDYMTQLIEQKRELITSVKDARTQQNNLVEHLKKTV